MKVSRRVVLLIITFVLLISSFSLNVSAEENVVYNMKSFFTDKNGNYTGFPEEELGTECTFQSSEFTVNMDSSYVMSYYMSFSRQDGKLMLKKGQVFDATVTKFLPYIYFTSTGNDYYWKNLRWYSVEMVYTDDTRESANVADCGYIFSDSTNSSTLTLNARMTAKKDVEAIRFILQYSPYSEISTTLNNRSFIFYAIHRPVSFSINVQSEEAGLLDGILNSVTDFFGNFFQNLIDTIVGIFIPDDDFFETYFDDLYNFFHEKLGFLLYPFELLAKLLNVFLELDEGSGCIVIPDVKMFNTTLLPATTFNLKEAFSSILGDYYDLYYAFVDLFFLIAFVNLAKSKFDKIVR